MSTHRLVRPLVLFVALAAIPACSSDDEAEKHGGHDDGGTPAGSCADDPRVSTFASGLQAKSPSGKLAVEIVSATPSPPQRGAGDAGINAWTVKLSVDGQPPAQPITVEATMPDHGHSSTMTPTVTANPDGTFTVTGLYLFMAGVWQIIFSLGPAEPAMFTLCVQ